MALAASPSTASRTLANASAPALVPIERPARVPSPVVGNPSNDKYSPPPLIVWYTWYWDGEVNMNSSHSFFAGRH